MPREPPIVLPVSLSLLGHANPWALLLAKEDTPHERVLPRPRRGECRHSPGPLGDLDERKGYRLERTLIVDDTPAKCVHNYGNAIYVKEYNGEEGDNELPSLFRYLATLKDAADVRTIEKRHGRSVVGHQTRPAVVDGPERGS